MVSAETELGYSTGQPPPPDGLPACRLGAAHPTLTAWRITGAFHARGRVGVQKINDGWLVLGEDGYYFGVEDAEMLEPWGINVLPSSFSDGLLTILAQAQVGVAYVANLVPFGVAETVASAAIVSGLAPNGLTIDDSDLADVELSGTPIDDSPGVFSFEVLWRYADGRSGVHRFAMTCIPA